MKFKTISRLLAGAVFTVTLTPENGNAQSNPRYIQFSPRAVKGALYVPDTGTAPRIGVLVAHRNSNFLSHISTTELSKRGFMVLGLNTRFDNNEALVDFEQIAVDIRKGVDFLRKQSGIQKVVLIAASGGGPMMSYYQATAEKGTSFCNDPKKLTRGNPHIV